ncbi:hypothetical protein NL108_011449 [Boleophthalmus pectinirostris]|nr:hypothetical protein NL108_011449 [Boleophthalmus pectinirostris]
MFLITLAACYSFKCKIENKAQPLPHPPFPGVKTFPAPLKTLMILLLQMHVCLGCRVDIVCVVGEVTFGFGTSVAASLQLSLWQLESESCTRSGQSPAPGRVRVLHQVGYLWT